MRLYCTLHSFDPGDGEAARAREAPKLWMVMYLSGDTTPRLSCLPFHAPMTRSVSWNGPSSPASPAFATSPSMGTVDAPNLAPCRRPQSRNNTQTPSPFYIDLAITLNPPLPPVNATLFRCLSSPLSSGELLYGLFLTWVSSIPAASSGPLPPAVRWESVSVPSQPLLTSDSRHLSRLEYLDTHHPPIRPHSVRASSSDYVYLDRLPRIPIPGPRHPTRIRARCHSLTPGSP